MGSTRPPSLCSTTSCCVPGLSNDHDDIDIGRRRRCSLHIGCSRNSIKLSAACPLLVYLGWSSMGNTIPWCLPGCAANVSPGVQNIFFGKLSVNPIELCYYWAYWTPVLATPWIKALLVSLSALPRPASMRTARCHSDLEESR